MAIRLPLKTVASFSDANEVGAGSVAGGVAHTFTIPQDTDNIVLKFAASLVGGASALLQTTDDGGTTWYDVARTSIVSNTPAGNEEWLSTPVDGFGVRTFTGNGVIGSVGGGTSASALGTIGNAAASSLGAKQQTGLPILSQQARVFIILNGNITAAAANLLTTEIKVNSQSATA